MTVVPGSIQSQITAINVSAVLSITGNRNVFPDSRSNTTERPRSFHDFLRAAQQIVQHNLSTELGPLSDCCRNELILLFGSVSRNAANDVVREKQNLHKVQATLLKTRTVRN